MKKLLTCSIVLTVAGMLAVSASAQQQQGAQGQRQMPSPEEMEKIMKERMDSMFNLVDKDQDGSIDMEEFKAMQNPAPPSQRQAQRTQTRSGTVASRSSTSATPRVPVVVKTPQEAKRSTMSAEDQKAMEEKQNKLAEEAFGEMDENDDKKISKEEFQAGLMKMRASSMPTAGATQTQGAQQFPGQGTATPAAPSRR